MTPSQIGERAEMAVVMALSHVGKTVYLPIGASGRYFRTASNTRNTPKDYRGQVEFFGVYCHDRRETYLVPVEDVPLRGAQLRLTVPRSSQSKGIRWARDYLLATLVPPTLCEAGDYELLTETAGSTALNVEP